jgi:taurine dioxygenase
VQEGGQSRDTYMDGNNSGYQHITVDRLAGAGGGVISGVDLFQNLSDDVISEIRRALIENFVIFFRDQSLTEEALMAFGSRFGDLLVHPNLIRTGLHPEVVNILKEPHATQVVGEDWHADTTCLATPPMGGILYALETPPWGGNTIFANQYLAYEALSDGMKQLLGRLRAVHNDTRVAGPKSHLGKGRSVSVRVDDEWKVTESVHPVVRTHPESKRKSLFVNISYTRRFEGMTEEESNPLLNYLFAHAARPEFTFQFRWDPGSITFWDNRCINHLAVNDYHGYRRDMRRVQVVGDRPV